jgi:hypothetical protein
MSTHWVEASLYPLSECEAELFIHAELPCNIYTQKTIFHDLTWFDMNLPDLPLEENREWKHFRQMY